MILMKYRVYTMRDIVAENYGMPSYFVNDQVAMRSIKAAVQQPKSQLAQVIDDMEVYVVAEFDDQTGIMKPFDKHILVCKGSSLFPKNVGE